ncbi:MAG: glycosyltransferase [Bacteroidales bacterium]|nr:glycosyltransferase [Bacteroidales bacterium]MBQ1882896.1 glycosyltransferase [Bacteroidales bacterium]MBQ2483417.1 glycosyltransferase [Bacteroidales bacterium]MBQ2492970.1 glycosyltransferase [Bacteroidales bacterium]MBQ4196902.1 glycosyltransferase [Bacteroidales bacterium]
MRIAILSCFYPFRGGISQFNTYLLKELSKKHDVKAFNFKRQYPGILFPGKTQKVAQDDDALPVESISVLDTANPLTYGKTAKVIAEYGPDLLITRYWMSYFAPSLGSVTSKVASILKKKGKSGFKAVAIADNIIPHEKHFFDIPLARFFVRRQSGIVTLSHSVEQELHQICPEAKSLTIPHPLYSNFGERTDTLEARKKLGMRGSDEEILSRKVLLFFGLIRDYKGLDLLLEAMPLLDGSYTLVVAGENYGSFEKYSQIINSERFAPVRNNLILVNRYIPDGEVKVFFSAADVSVLPYRSATQSGISSISWNFDVPLITTPVGGLVESVGQAGTGMLTESVSAKGVADAVKKYFAENKKEEYLYNISRLKRELSWETFADKLETFVNTL